MRGRTRASEMQDDAAPKVRTGRWCRVEGNDQTLTARNALSRTRISSATSSSDGQGSGLTATGSVEAQDVDPVGELRFVLGGSIPAQCVGPRLLPFIGEQSHQPAGDIVDCEPDAALDRQRIAHLAALPLKGFGRTSSVMRGAVCVMPSSIPTNGERRPQMREPEKGRWFTESAPDSYAAMSPPPGTATMQGAPALVGGEMGNGEKTVPQRETRTP